MNLANSYSTPVNIFLKFSSRQFSLVGSLLVRGPLIHNVLNNPQKKTQVGTCVCVFVNRLTTTSLVGEKKSLVTLGGVLPGGSYRGQGPFVVTTVHLISKANLSEERNAHGSQRAVCTQ